MIIFVQANGKRASTCMKLFYLHGSQKHFNAVSSWLCSTIERHDPVKKNKIYSTLAVPRFHKQQHLQTEKCKITNFFFPDGKTLASICLKFGTLAMDGRCIEELRSIFFFMYVSRDSLQDQQTKRRPCSVTATVVLQGRQTVVYSASRAARELGGRQRQEGNLCLAYSTKQLLAAWRWPLQRAADTYLPHSSFLGIPTYLMKQRAPSNV